jgi:hypothetical protein
LPTTELSDEIVPLEGFEYNIEGDMITLKASYLEDESIYEMIRYINIRAGGM